MAKQVCLQPSCRVNAFTNSEGGGGVTCMQALYTTITEHAPPSPPPPPRQQHALSQMWKPEDQRSNLPQFIQPVHRSPGPVLPDGFPPLSLEGLPTGDPFIKGAFGMLPLPHPPTPALGLLPLLLFPEPLLLLLGFPQGLLATPSVSRAS